MSLAAARQARAGSLSILVEPRRALSESLGLHELRVVMKAVFFFPNIEGRLLFARA